MQDNKFKQYGKFDLLKCKVDINEKRAKVISECPEQAQICARYLYLEGFVNDEDNIEYREK